MEEEKEITIGVYESDLDRMKKLAWIIKEARAEYSSILLKYSRDKQDEIFNMSLYYEDVVCPAIEDLTGITMEQIKSHDRKKEVVNARKWLVAVMYENHVGPSAAARFIGGRDHATIINLYRKHNDHMQVDPVYRRNFNQFKSKLEGEK